MRKREYPSWLKKKQLLALYRRRVTEFFRHEKVYKETIFGLQRIIDRQRERERQLKIVLKRLEEEYARND